MSSPIVEGATLQEALAKLAARMPAGTESLTITGVRRAGTWRVQGSIPLQRGRCQCPWDETHRADCPSWAPGRVQ